MSRHRMTNDVLRCPYCREPFANGVSCTIVDTRLPFGREYGGLDYEVNPDRDPGIDPEDVYCRDCGVRWGGQHHEFCCVAICSLCENQMLGHDEQECVRDR